METLKFARCTENNNQVQVSSLEGFELSHQDSDKHLVLIVHITLDDVWRRKRNVVVSGLPEETTTSDDRQAVLQLCKAHLPIKPVLRDCVRLGIPVSGQPRRLLIRLESEEAASTILKSAPSLRRSTDEWIVKSAFINPDLSPAAAKVAYEQRQLRRQQLREQHGNDGTGQQELISPGPISLNHSTSHDQITHKKSDHLTSDSAVSLVDTDSNIQQSMKSTPDQDNCATAALHITEPFQH